jgi:hypothetical protein
LDTRRARERSQGDSQDREETSLGDTGQVRRRRLWNPSWKKSPISDGRRPNGIGVDGATLKPLSSHNQWPSRLLVAADRLDRWWRSNDVLGFGISYLSEAQFIVGWQRESNQPSFASSPFLAKRRQGPDTVAPSPECRNLMWGSQGCSALFSTMNCLLASQFDASADPQCFPVIVGSFGDGEGGHGP